MRRLIIGIALLLSLPFHAAAQQVTGPGTGSISQAIHPGYISGKWYLPTGQTGTSTNGTAPGANVVNCATGGAPSQVTWTTVGTVVTTLFAGGNAQAALYSNVNGRPGTLLATSASMSTTSAVGVTGALTPAGGNTATFGPGTANGTVFWVCTDHDNATSALRGFLGTTIGPSALIGASSQGNMAITAVSCSAGICAFTFGSWPASLAGATWADNITNTTTAQIALQAQ